MSTSIVESVRHHIDKAPISVTQYIVFAIAFMLNVVDGRTWLKADRSRRSPSERSSAGDMLRRCVHESTVSIGEVGQVIPSISCRLGRSVVGVPAGCVCTVGLRVGRGLPVHLSRHGGGAAVNHREDVNHVILQNNLCERHLVFLVEPGSICLRPFVCCHRPLV